MVLISSLFSRCSTGLFGVIQTPLTLLPRLPVDHKNKRSASVLFKSLTGGCSVADFAKQGFRIPTV